MDRKELIRKYKETRRPMGVFRVHNRIEGKSLLGTSVDLPSMLNRQRAQLKLGAHRAAELQRDWARLGPEAFDFEVVDTLPERDEPVGNPADDLRVLEAMWRERLQETGESFYAPN